MFIRSTAPDLNLQSMLPAINEVIMGKYNMYPQQFPKIFNVDSTKRSIEQVTQLSGFGQFVQTPEAQPVTFDTAVPGFNKTYQPKQFSLGFQVSRRAQDTDQFGVVKKFSVELGKSAKDCPELYAAAVFNTGFSTNGYDNVPLFSLSHPLVKSGGVQSNRLSYATDPDVTSLQLALTDCRTTVDSSGKRVRIPMRKLIVPPQLQFVAPEILGGKDWRPDTANRTINAFRDIDGYPSFDQWMVWDYLTDPNSWFLAAAPEDTGLKFWWAEKFNLEHDIDSRTRSILTMGWMVFDVGYHDFYGVYGAPSS